MTTVTPEAVALEFVRDLKENLTPEQFAEVRRRNATPEYAHACASHDYIDANESMMGAFEALGIINPNEIPGDDLTPLWNAAWDIAKRDYLTAPVKPAR